MSELKNKIISLRRDAASVIELYENQLSPGRETCYDKTDFGFGTWKAAHDLHNVIYFRHHSGTYGNGSVSSVFPDYFVKYVAMAIDEQKEQMIYRASELMIVEVEMLIKELKEERDKIDLIINEMEADAK